ncbi:MAG: A24 family peptidase [Planctomycetaceae bacterium]
MPELTSAQVVLLLCVGLFTLAAAICDLRYRKIPNRMTAPMCVAGIVYQVAFFQWDGLWSALLGFGAGFGILFVLWMIATAGGGDVKLMAALGTWLGWLTTLKVLFCSLIFVTTGTIGIVVIGMLSQGLRRTKEQYLTKSTKGKAETTDQRQKRRVMAFAVPVALATWCILAFQLFATKG